MYAPCRPADASGSRESCRPPGFSEWKERKDRTELYRSGEPGWNRPRWRGRRPEPVHLGAAAMGDNLRVVVRPPASLRPQRQSWRFDDPRFRLGAQAETSLERVRRSLLST